ncbi:MAG: hypothetical protein LLG00_02790 [Planctomycetaceae bacterium]|nr:hypothetical protein [Planctomycetaceae bacterium]
MAASTAAVPLIVYVDNVILHDDVSEYSITEITQETLLLLSTVLVLVTAWRRADTRGFLMLVGGFFACMLIRELDFLFDVIRHGFWVYPAILTAAGTIACAAAWRKSVLPAAAAYVGTRSCVYMTIGLLVVLLLSRLFGSGRLIWSDIIATDQYKTLYKTIIQEGLELFGYIFVFYASCLLARKR